MAYFLLLVPLASFDRGGQEHGRTIPFSRQQMRFQTEMKAILPLLPKLPL